MQRSSEQGFFSGWGYVGDGTDGRDHQSEGCGGENTGDIITAPAAPAAPAAPVSVHFSYEYYNNGVVPPDGGGDYDHFFNDRSDSGVKDSMIVYDSTSLLNTENPADLHLGYGGGNKPVAQQDMDYGEKQGSLPFERIYSSGRDTTKERINWGKNLVSKNPEFEDLVKGLYNYTGKRKDRTSKRQELIRNPKLSAAKIKAIASYLRTIDKNACRHKKA